nr:leucine-rich repeat domain-containing protein [Candidatus Sigynarchaeota archaeon]
MYTPYTFPIKYNRYGKRLQPFADAVPFGSHEDLRLVVKIKGVEHEACIKWADELSHEFFMIGDDIWPLEVTLRIQDIPLHSIQEIEDLDTIPRIDYLRINNTHLSDLEGMSDMPWARRLKILDLSNNSIDKMTGLSGFKRLHSLYLNTNRIQHIVGLEDLKYLKLIDLSNNQIESIIGLERGRRIRKVGLNHNKINTLDHSTLMDLPAHPMTIRCMGNEISPEQLDRAKELKTNLTFILK